jgi:hypothetical protein
MVVQVVTRTTAAIAFLVLTARRARRSILFVNVRKGSFDHVARNDVPAAPPSLGSLRPSPR